MIDIDIEGPPRPRPWAKFYHELESRPYLNDIDVVDTSEGISSNKRSLALLGLAGAVAHRTFTSHCAAWPHCH